MARRNLVCRAFSGESSAKMGVGSSRRYFFHAPEISSVSYSLKSGVDPAHTLLMRNTARKMKSIWDGINLEGNAFLIVLQMTRKKARTVKCYFENRGGGGRRGVEIAKRRVYRSRKSCRSD